MNGVLKRVDVTGMAWLMEQYLRLSTKETQVMLDAGRDSDPLLAGMLGDELICFIGLVPPTLLSDQAYLWMYSTPAVAKHKIMVGRFAKRFVAEAQKRYPMIVGHCLDSQRWLESLGAVVCGHEFRIGVT